MTLYFDNRLGDIPGSIEELSFAKNYALVAIRSWSASTEQGVISIYNSDSELIDSEVKGISANSLSWHPSKQILAVSWTNGEISIWNGETKSRTVESELAPDGCEHLLWSLPNGKRLLTADKEGYVKAWRANNKAQLQKKAAWEHLLEGGVADLLCRPQEGVSSDLAKMAVAAVSGEELMSSSSFNSRSSQFDLTQNVQVENLSFYFATKNGEIVFVDPKGSKSIPKKLEGEAKKIFFCPYRSILVVAMADMSLHAFRSSLDGALQEMKKVKLSGSTISCTWVAPAILVSATGDTSLKIWDLQRNEHNLIQAEESNAKIVEVKANQKTGVIAAASSDAGVLFWQFSKSRNGIISFNQKKATLNQKSKTISWFEKSSLSPLLATANEESASLLREQKIQESSVGGTHVVQTGPQSVRISPENGQPFDFNVDIPVQGISICTKPSPALTIWNGKTILSYEIEDTQLFCKSTGIICPHYQNLINNQNIYSFSEDLEKIQVHSLAGIEKQVLNLGSIGTEMDSNGTYLIVSCLPSTIRVYDLSRREAKQTVNRDVATLIPDISHVHTVKVNSTGNKIAFLGQGQSGLDDGRVYIYSPDRQKIQVHDTHHALSRLGDHISEEETISGFNQNGTIRPVDLKWDERDPSLLCVHYQGESDNLLVCYWATDNGLIEQEEVQFPENSRTFLSLRAPFFVFSSNDDVVCHPLRDFVGLENCDDTTRSALLDFSRQMAIGDLDAAFNSIKLIKNERVWLNLAKRCVFTKRLDVAKVCLANMGNARAAAALRKAQKEPELEAQIAMLALQLGLVPEAEKLYKQAKRYDLLNKFYQSIDRWDEALEIAEKHDRLHLRATHYQYAKKLEWEKNYHDAIKHYEESKTNVFEVPRMLFDDPDALEEYVSKNSEPQLRKWWAQYQEFCGEFEQAEKYYKQCQDYLSLVRVFCCLDRIDEADKLANETGDHAACYHMARHHESSGNIKQAIHFFTRASAYNNVIRICKEHGFEDQLLNVALLSSPSDMLEAAQYFQAREDTIDKSVLLYHRAGNLAKAIELVFNYRRFGALENLVEELDKDTDVNVLTRCADFFLENNRHAKAAYLFLLSKEYVKALKLIIDYDVEITNGMVQQFILPKEVPNRTKIMEAVAQHCYDRTQFQEAAQLYQHAGMRQDAMKCLARLGDTKKMVEFAQLARDPNLFVLAANYLRSALTWQNDPSILKAIVTFYRKAKKLESLANFFAECSNHTVDTTGDYNRAIGLLGEALKQLSSSKQDTTEIEQMIRSRAMKIKEFIDLKSQFASDPTSSVGAVESMLSEVKSEDGHPVRASDLAGMLVEYYSQTDTQKALDYARLIQKLQQGPVGDFVSSAAIQRLRASQTDPKESASGTSIGSDEVQERIKNY